MHFGIAPSNPETNTIINALETVLGYIGVEAATTDIFARLLWPQRSFAFFGIDQILKVALLLPSGGPLYKASLEVLNVAARHGLFDGREEGHMLGTSFFPAGNERYTLHSDDPKYPSASEVSRNNLWARVLGLTPVPRICSFRADSEQGAPATTTVRTKIAVHYLHLNVAKSANLTSRSLLRVDHESGRPSTRVYVGINVSQLSGVLAAIAIFVIWRSPFAANSGLYQNQHFEIHMPSESGRFIILSGPPALGFQFFRHYGHTKRDRTRELIQLAKVSL